MIQKGHCGVYTVRAVRPMIHATREQQLFIFCCMRVQQQHFFLLIEQLLLAVVAVLVFCGVLGCRIENPLETPFSFFTDRARPFLFMFLCICRSCISDSPFSYRAPLVDAIPPCYYSRRAYRCTSDQTAPCRVFAHSKSNTAAI